jgi:GNAT superfamily N-acetyltransferase
MTDGVGISIRQFTDAWRLMCTRAPGHTLATADGIEYVFSGLPVAFFNVAVLTSRALSAEALSSQGRQACEWASATGVPWLLILTHEGLADGVDAAAVLDGCGLAPMMPMTGMRAERVSPVVSLPAGLQLTEPRDEAGCSAVLDVNGLAYGMDLGGARSVVGRPAFWQGQFPVLGLAGETPASCAAVLMVDGVRYVAMVATDPDHQRRGYADAAMRRALELSARAHGEQPTVLHATDAGRPVYERMGYTAISTHTVFIEKRFLAGH